MVPCYDRYIYETWRSKEGESHKGGEIFIGGVDPSRHRVRASLPELNLSTYFSSLSSIDS